MTVSTEAGRFWALPANDVASGVRCCCEFAKDGQSVVASDRLAARTTKIALQSVCVAVLNYLHRLAVQAHRATCEALLDSTVDASCASSAANSTTTRLRLSRVSFLNAAVIRFNTGLLIFASCMN